MVRCSAVLMWVLKGIKGLNKITRHYSLCGYVTWRREVGTTSVTMLLTTSRRQVHWRSMTKSWGSGRPSRVCSLTVFDRSTLASTRASPRHRPYASSLHSYCELVSKLNAAIFIALPLHVSRRWKPLISASHSIQPGNQRTLRDHGHGLVCRAQVVYPCNDGHPPRY